MLHHYHVTALLLARLQRLHDVHVVEARREPRLLIEHVHPLGDLLARFQLRIRARLGLAQNLHDDELREPALSALRGEVHVGHAAAAEQAQKLILAERRQ